MWLWEGVLRQTGSLLSWSFGDAHKLEHGAVLDVLGGSVVGELLGVLEDHYTQRLGVALDLHKPVKQRAALLLW